MVLGSLLPPCVLSPREQTTRWATATQTGGEGSYASARERWSTERRGPTLAQWTGLSKAEARGLREQLESTAASASGLIFAPIDGDFPFRAIVVGPVVTTGTNAATWSVECTLEERLP